MKGTLNPSAALKIKVLHWIFWAIFPAQQITVEPTYNTAYKKHCLKERTFYSTVCNLFNSQRFSVFNEQQPLSFTG